MLHRDNWDRSSASMRQRRTSLRAALGLLFLYLLVCLWVLLPVISSTRFRIRALPAVIADSPVWDIYDVDVEQSAWEGSARAGVAKPGAGGATHASYTPVPTASRAVFVKVGSGTNGVVGGTTDRKSGRNGSRVDYEGAYRSNVTSFKLMAAGREPAAPSASSAQGLFHRSRGYSRMHTRSRNRFPSVSREWSAPSRSHFRFRSGARGGSSPPEIEGTKPFNM